MSGPTHKDRVVAKAKALGIDTAGKTEPELLCEIADSRKLTVHCRTHEMGKAPRIRVWTDEMAGYGQFNVLSNADANTLKAVGQDLGIRFRMHHCDGIDDCNCSVLDRDELLK